MGDAVKSIQAPIRDYNILAFQFDLSHELKAEAFICIFEDAAKSHVIANVREEMSFEEMKKIIRSEF